MNAIDAIAQAPGRLPVPLSAAGAAGAGGEFGHSLALALGPDDREALRAAASQLVASTFVQPLLSRLRESPFLEGPFAPGLAEKQFAPLLDQHLADRIVQGGSFPLVDLIVERLAGPSGSTFDG